MTAVTIPAAPGGTTEIRARKAGFVADLVSVAGRALRSIPREPEMLFPALFIPVFFYVVNTGALQDFSQAGIPGFDFKAFQLPVAIVFAVTGVSRANVLVTDIQNGYFDRLVMTPISRPALLLGLMISDLALVCGLAVPVLILGLVTGVSFNTGLLGMLAFVIIGGLWGLAFTGFPYAIALKTGSPGAVSASFLLFFPFAFLTTATLPKEALTG
jgi:ABC-2 type transport system permease protein